MNRAIIVYYKSEFKIFSSLKKACKDYQLNYVTVGKHLRDKGEWKKGHITIQRHTVE